MPSDAMTLPAEAKRHDPVLPLAVRKHLGLQLQALYGPPPDLGDTGPAMCISALTLVDERLIRVLEDWCPSFPGFYLYYSGRRQMSAALRALINTLTGALTEEETPHCPRKEDVPQATIPSLQTPVPSLDSLRGIARGVPTEGYRDRDDRDERY